MSFKMCPECGASNSSFATNCLCGADLQEKSDLASFDSSTTKCPNCNQPLKGQSECPICGHYIYKRPASSPPHSKSAEVSNSNTSYKEAKSSSSNLTSKEDKVLESKYKALKGFALALKIIGAIGSLGILAVGTAVANHTITIGISIEAGFSIEVLVTSIIIASVFFIFFLISSEIFNCFADIGDNTYYTHLTNKKILQELKKLNNKNL
ncbi:MAG: hypothetical protein GX370_00780 [Clostridia bacterium]|mgnify:CR=1 FL=1|jgi:uncharacterized Zn finger protein (UPF0148 family)|nr:hypothetical protein [Clostridia bacterium]